MPELDAAIHCLVTAIRQKYPRENGSHESQIIGAMAEAAVRQSLVAAASAFWVQPTRLTLIGEGTMSVRRNSPHASTRLKQLIKNSDFCQELFSIGPERPGSLDTLVVHLQAIIPEASPEIRALLPTVPWPDQRLSAQERTQRNSNASRATPLAQTGSAPAISGGQNATFDHRTSLNAQNGTSLPGPSQAQVMPLATSSKAISMQPPSAADLSLQHLLDSGYDLEHGKALLRCNVSANSRRHQKQLRLTLPNSSVPNEVIPPVVDADAVNAASLSPNVPIRQPNTGHHKASPQSPVTSPPVASIFAGNGLLAGVFGRFLGYEPPSSTAAAAGPHTGHTSVEPDPVVSMLQLLPHRLASLIQQRLEHHSRNGHERVLSDIVADLGRPVRLRYCSHPLYALREEDLTFSLNIEEAVVIIKAARESSQSGGKTDLFKTQSRTGIDKTLHRISGMTNSHDEVYGLTYRIGRHFPGAAEPLRDAVSKVADGNQETTTGSLLLLGPPGVGKTTLLRDITCQLADKFGKLVMVVDPNEEIAGGGNVPHACIGSARRMLGSSQQSKYEVLQEAVANHGPEVIVVDEIGCAKEGAAIRDIAQRGVAVVATAHGTNLQNLLNNPILNSLVGGKQKMVIGDDAARSYDGRKTKQERCEAPTFSMLVEVVDHHTFVLHADVAASIDAILQGRQPATELRSTSCTSH